MSTISAGTTSTTTLQVSGDTTGSLVIKTNDTGSGGTTAMTIDTSQKVGIGTTNSNAFKLAVVGGRIQLSGGTTSQEGVAIQRISGAATITGINNDNNAYNALAFQTSASEAMRIDSSGNVGIGATSPGNRLLVTKSDNTYYLTDFANSFSSGNGYINRMNFSSSSPNNTSSIFSAMVDNVGSRCLIYANGGISNYQANNSNLSDQREKTNFAPAKPYLDTICAIPVQTFNYIDQNLVEDSGLTLGVVAQDVQTVAPELVHESNWGTEEAPKMRLSIYQTDLQYALMKCIQELKAELDATKAEIAALKGA